MAKDDCLPQPVFWGLLFVGFLPIFPPKVKGKVAGSFRSYALFPWYAPYARVHWQRGCHRACYRVILPSSDAVSRWARQGRRQSTGDRLRDRLHTTTLLQTTSSHYALKYSAGTA